MNLNFLFAPRVNRPPMDLQRFEPSPRRIIARWALIPSDAAYLCHFGFFIFSDGSVQFYDHFGHRLACNQSAITWETDFWFRELWDHWQRGEAADIACHFSRTIRLPRHLIRAVMRLNERNLTSLSASDWADWPSWLLNLELEKIFWAQLAELLPLAPLKRESPATPDRPFPADYRDVVCNVPTDETWWAQ